MHQLHRSLLILTLLLCGLAITLTTQTTQSTGFQYPVQITPPVVTPLPTQTPVPSVPTRSATPVLLDTIRFRATALQRIDPPCCDQLSVWRVHVDEVLEGPPACAPELPVTFGAGFLPRLGYVDPGVRPGDQAMVFGLYQSAPDRCLVDLRETIHYLTGVGRPVSQAEAGRPAIAYNPARDEYLVVWSQPGVGSPDRDLVARRFAATGVPLGDAFVVSDAPGDQFAPAAAYNLASHDYLVVWTDGRADGGQPWPTNLDIYGRLISGLGQPLKEFPLVSAAGNQMAPAIAADIPGGGWLVAWTDDRNPAGPPPVSANTPPHPNLDVYAQFVDPNGEPWIPLIPIATANWADEASPAVAYDPGAGVFLVAYGNERDVGPAHLVDIQAQRVSAVEGLLGNPVQVSSAVGYQRAPAVAFDTMRGMFLVAWEDTRNDQGSAVTPDHDIYAQAVSPEGQLLGANLSVIQAPGWQRNVALAYNRVARAFFATWDDLREGLTTRFDIYARQMGMESAYLGPDFPVAAAVGDQFTPAVAASSWADAYLVAWFDQAQGQLWVKTVYGPSSGLPRPTPTPSSEPVLSHVKIQPAAPTEDDEVKLTVYGEWGTGCPQVNYRITRFGQNIYFEGLLSNVVVYPPAMCTMIVSFWSVTDTLGFLAEGDYSLTATVVDGHWSFTENKSFNVRSTTRNTVWQQQQYLPLIQR